MDLLSRARPNDRWCLAARCLLLATTLLVWVPAARGAVSETELKSAVLLRILELVEWPRDHFEDAGSPIVVNVAGDRRFATTLAATLADKRAHGRRIVVEATEDGSCRSCAVLVLGRSALPGSGDVLPSGSTLILMDSPEFGGSLP